MSKQSNDDLKAKRNRAFWLYENEDSHSCAGQTIKASASFFSSYLLEGCKRFSSLSINSSDSDEVIIYNTACIMNAVSYLEARLNELLALAQICFNESATDSMTWSLISSIKNRISFQEKWDLLASIDDRILWDKSKEPFQSIETMISLRNELVHYKAFFLSKNEAPSNKIKSLMKKLNISSKALWVGDDCSTWLSELLEARGLSEWVLERIDFFNSAIYSDKSKNKD